MSYLYNSNQSNNNNSSRWGQWGSKLQGWSSQLFGDDLAEELQPMRAVPPPAPVPTTPEELQQAMKELMGHPTLWAQYKQRLAQQENPTQPETVRSVLISFLQEHPLPSKSALTTSSAVRHAPPAHPHPTNFPSSQQQQQQQQQQQSKRPSRPSMTWNMGFSEESTHVSSSVSLFSKSEHPPSNAPPPAAAAAPLPHATTHAVPSAKRTSSLFSALNTNLLGESMHFTTDPSELQQQQQQQQAPSTPTRTTTSTRRPSSSSPSMEQNLRLLRSAPELYTKYQERLLEDESAMDTPAADVLTQFLKDHRSELKGLFDDEEERKKHEAALLHLEETATLAEEQSQRAIRLLPGTSNSRATTAVTSSVDGPAVLALGGSSSDHQELPASARTVWMDLSDRKEGQSSSAHPGDGILERSLGGASSSWLAWNASTNNSTTTPQKPPLVDPQNQQQHKLEASFREGWRTVSTFVAQGMESMNLELHPEDLVENHEDAEPPSEQEVMQFSDEVVMDDPVLQQAAEIAKRRRGELANVATEEEAEDGTKEVESVAPHHAHLEAIQDVDEDTIDVSEHVKVALNDPMMQVTMHNGAKEEPEVPKEPEPVTQAPTTSTDEATEEAETPVDGEADKNDEPETEGVIPPASAHSAGGVDHLL